MASLYASNSSSVICIALCYGSAGKIYIFTYGLVNRKLVNQLYKMCPLSRNEGESQARETL